MPSAKRNLLTLCSIAAVVCALVAAAGMHHALTDNYDAAIRHFAVNAPGALVAACLSIAGILIGCAAALLIRKEKTATTPASGAFTTFASVVTAFMMLAVFMMSVRAFSGAEILPQIKVVLTALAAVYFFLIPSDKMADNGILPFVSILPALYAVVSMLAVYFDKTYAMNSPVKIYDLAMYAAMALFFVAEARCALRIPRPASYAFCGIACTVMCTVNGASHFLVALHDTVGHGFSLVESAVWLCVALYALSRLFDFGKAAVEDKAKAEGKSDTSEEATHAE